MATRFDALVRERAQFRCEYCHFSETWTELPFEVDHIIAQKHGGKTDPRNLALACCYCNRHKGPNLSGIDPLTGRVEMLFHPRTDRWQEHFAWTGPVLEGQTGVGRATVQTLQINRPDRTAVRRMLMTAGEYQ